MNDYKTLLEAFKHLKERSFELEMDLHHTRENKDLEMKARDQREQTLEAIIETLQDKLEQCVCSKQ